MMWVSLRLGVTLSADSLRVHAWGKEERIAWSAVTAVGATSERHLDLFYRTSMPVVELGDDALKIGVLARINVRQSVSQRTWRDVARIHEFWRQARVQHEANASDGG